MKMLTSILLLSTISVIHGAEPAPPMPKVEVLCRTDRRVVGEVLYNDVNALVLRTYDHDRQPPEAIEAITIGEVRLVRQDGKVVYDTSVKDAVFPRWVQPGPSVEFVKSDGATVSGPVILQNASEVVIFSGSESKRQLVNIGTNFIRKARQDGKVIYDATQDGAALPIWMSDPSESVTAVDGGRLFMKRQTSGGALWIPDGVERLRFVMLFACKYKTPDREIRQTLARLGGAAMDIGPIGTAEVAAEASRRFVPGNYFAPWAEMRGMKDVQTSLDHYARRSGHPELAHLPLVGWGLSRGGSCVQILAEKTPERYLGVISYHGSDGRELLGLKDPSQRVPILVMVGGNDMIGSATTGAQAAGVLRSANYPNGFIFQKGYGHPDFGDLELQMSWVEAVAKLRLPAAAPTDRPPTLLPVDPTRQGWLGEVNTGVVASVTEYRGEIATSSWFPDEATAKIWSKVHNAAGLAPKVVSEVTDRALVTRVNSLLFARQAEEARRVVVWSSGPADDPRPHVLVIGGQECRPPSDYGVPYREGPSQEKRRPGQFSDPGLSWPESLALAKPEWRASSITAANWLVGDAADQVESHLSSIGKIGLVVLFFGINESADHSWKSHSAQSFAADLRRLIAVVRKNPFTTNAKIAVVTPLPFTQEWFDEWTARMYSQAESHADDLIATFSTVATETGCTLVDLAAEVRPPRLIRIPESASIKAVPTGMPVFDLKPDDMPVSWLFAGPFPGRDLVTNLLAGQTVLPVPGSTLTAKSRTCSFFPTTPEHLFCATHTGNFATLNVTDLHSIAKKRVPNSTGILVTMVRNDQERILRFHTLLSDTLPNERLDQRVWLGGVEINVKRSLIELPAGTFPLVIQTSAGICQSWGKIFFRPRFAYATKEWKKVETVGSVSDRRSQDFLGQGLHRIPGPSGVFVMADGHELLARYFARQLPALNLVPEPNLAAGLKDHQRAQTDLDRLTAILASTSTGEVDCGPALVAASTTASNASIRQTAVSYRGESIVEDTPQFWNATVTVPSALLRECAGCFILTSGGDHFTAISLEESNRPQLKGLDFTVNSFGKRIEEANRPHLFLTMVDGTTVLRSLPQSGVQRIDESDPQQAPALMTTWWILNHWDIFQRPCPVAGGPSGNRQRILLRFDLSGLDLAKVKQAELRVELVNYVQPDWVKPLKASVVIHPILGLDRDWIIGRATWKTRDGKTPWTGGCSDPSKRRTDLTAFLAAKPHPTVEAMAQDALARLTRENQP